jgi:hypothetical protein
MLKKCSSRDSIEFKIDHSEDTLALKGYRAEKSFFDEVCQQLPIYKIVRFCHHKETPRSVDLENEEGVDGNIPGRKTFANICAEVMMPQPGLFVRPPNDWSRQNVLTPVLEGQDARLSCVAALMAASMISN